MQLESLRYFVEVAQTNSITKASQNMFLSQQGISRSIQQLEQELECTLLIRGQKGVSLTEEGEAVYNFALNVLAQKKEMMKTLNQIKYRDVAKSEFCIRIYSNSVVVNTVLPKTIMKLNERGAASINIEIVNNLEILFDNVINEKNAIGLITFNSKELHEAVNKLNNIICMNILSNDELVAVVNKRYYNSEINCISASRYSEYQFRTLYNIIPTEKTMENVKKYNMLCSNDTDFHRNLLDCDSDVVVMMAKLAYEYFFKSKKYISLPVENINVPLIHAAIYRNDVDNYIKDFVDMIQQEIESKLFEIHNQ